MSAEPYNFDADAWAAGADDDPARPTPEPPPEDCRRCGKDSCPGCAPTAEPSPQQRPHLQFRSAVDVIAEPRRRAVVEGLAFQDSLTMLVSESGAGKTFVALSLAAHVSQGRRWFGRRVRGGAVAYIAFECDDFGSRMQALDEDGHDLSNLYLARASHPLSPRVGRDGVETYSEGELAAIEALAELQVRAASPLVLVIVDTVRKSMSGSEDSSEHVSAYQRALSRIMATVPGAACVAVHHSGWNPEDSGRKRERGSSAWRGNSDATFYLEKGTTSSDGTEVRLILSTLKVRDAAASPPLYLVRRRVALNGFDEWGDPRSSCLIEEDRRSREDREQAETAQRQAEEWELDLRTLRAIADHPELATSQDRVRQLLACKKDQARDSITRLLMQRLLVAGRRGEPYRLTSEGLEALAGAPQNEAER
jgi:uncharacterized protein YjhX (UPF0386 family)